MASQGVPTIVEASAILRHVLRAGQTEVAMTTIQRQWFCVVVAALAAGLSLFREPRGVWIVPKRAVVPTN
jgi:uncharacterized membrane protein